MMSTYRLNCLVEEAIKLYDINMEAFEKVCGLEPVAICESTGIYPRYGTIYWANFKFDNISDGLDPNQKNLPKSKRKESKLRPVLFVNSKEYGKVAVRISHIDADPSDYKDPKKLLELRTRYNGKYTYLLEKWDEDGLAPSYLVCNDVRQLIHLTDIGERIGRIDNDEYMVAEEKLNIFMADREKYITVFLGYLKFMKPKYKKHGNITSNVEKEISEVDFIYILDNIANFYRSEYKILWTKIRDMSNIEYDHFTLITHIRNKNVYKASRYFANLPGKAETHTYDKIKDFDQIIKEESKWIEKHYPVNSAEVISSRYLTKDEINTLHKYGVAGKDSKEFIKFLNESV